MSWGPCILVHCIAVDLRPLHTTANESAGSVFFGHRCAPDPTDVLVMERQSAAHGVQNAAF